MQDYARLTCAGTGAGPSARSPRLPMTGTGFDTVGSNRSQWLSVILAPGPSSVAESEGVRMMHSSDSGLPPQGAKTGRSISALNPDGGEMGRNGFPAGLMRGHWVMNLSMACP